ncbi:Indole-3-glycerol phosphate synthase [hydrothermal vent metagenome]|uniref:indole-3-glycerol-phosphate synthase n=1 Tax=hydrothermal vent metagenome TaxID=652676 RepID=A0A3B0T6D1_9ZZZZ
MAILDKIIETKKVEVTNLKKITSIRELCQTPMYSRKCNSLAKSLLSPEASGIIAEFKQKSPSKGVINESGFVEEVTKGYVAAGASGLSVLTDFEYFGGNMVNLVKAREANPDTPLLRKDFMVDPIQIYEAKAYGADVILLIAACLENNQLKELAQTAKEIGLEVLVEVHNEQELEKVEGKVDLIGVNNRNLKTFEVDIETSVRLSALIPESVVKISESGLSEAKSIVRLRENGFDGFLIGETFMKTGNPAKACSEFIAEVKRI